MRYLLIKTFVCPQIALLLTPSPTGSDELKHPVTAALCVKKT